ncbi:PQQ-dependent sugar dehydrogenase [Corticibacter populi]|uniref:PQQ-dependent sugar dehydrogenase n=2 Tax=Corticibacter populi TaxID=1550736 RepID=A0A3M6QPL9_9BURK|nr:PQQ-dependent sugar dehydrogenase [Corticibacter populi]
MAALLCGAAAAQAQSDDEARPLAVTEVAYGLNHPWAVAFLPDGNFLVSERPGTLRVVDAQGRVGLPLAGVPAVAAEGQGGLLDLVLDRDFAQNRRLFFCFAEPDPGSGSRSSTALASARLSERQDRLEDVQVIFHQMPRLKSAQHFGCRIAQSGDGSLFLTLGERSIARDQAQRTTNHLGTIVHLTPEGHAAAGGPFSSRMGGLPEVWSWGHRNPQGAVITPDGELWMHEHGPQGGDELNHIRPGGNYGWPVITYGRNYGLGTRIGEGTAKDGMEQPVHQWTPSIAPSGMAFLTSDRYGPEWLGSFFIGSLKFGTLHRLKVAGDQVQQEERLLLGRGQRIRDVRQGPDGLLYLLTDSRNGRLLRVNPPEPPPAPEPVVTVEPLDHVEGIVASPADGAASPPAVSGNADGGSRDNTVEPPPAPAAP